MPRYIFQLMIAEIIFSIVFSFIFRINNVLISLFGAVVSSLYLLIDLHMVMNNKSHMLTLDDHVFASIMIYTDLIRLFMKILEILDKMNNDKKEKKK